MFFLGACTHYEKAHEIILKNPLSDSLKEVTFPLKDATDLGLISSIPERELIFMDGDSEVPYQVINSKDVGKYYLLEADFIPNEIKKITLRKGMPKKYKQKTNAIINIGYGGKWFWETSEDTGKKQYIYRGGKWKNVNSIWVDSKHVDHSLDIRYEGPVWGSDKIAYRFYLDWRNATDIFDEKTDSLVKQNVAEEFGSYYSMRDRGMDVFAVGNSLGIGSVGYWANSKANGLAKVASTNCTIDYIGNLKSKLTTSYYYWQYNGGTTDICSELSICAGSYLTKAKVISTEEIDNLCTGIVRNKEGVFINSVDSISEWSYIGTFGKQSIIKDNLGLAIFFRTNDLIKLDDDSLNHVVILKPENKEITYYFCGTWGQNSSQMNSMERFKAFLRKQQILLNAHLVD